MKVEPVASDSLGVRSLATYVETKDCKIFIDPSAELGPLRYGLPPSQTELNALAEFREIIREKAEKCDILVISHYHYDHHDPDETFYEGKTVYAKDRQKNINLSQQGRGEVFENNVKDACNLIYCDGKSFEIGKTRIKFSEPFPHGSEKTKLGYVLMTTVEEDFKLLHTSDVSGPIYDKAKDYIIKENPDLIIIDGPPTIFLGWRFSQKNLEDAKENLLKIISSIDCEIVLDHHLLRDLRYKERLKKVYEKGDVKTVAEFLGKENNMLEAHRKELWEKEKQ